MELAYTLLDPTGNITALVTDSVPVERQPEIALTLMAAEPEAEQVGFLSPGSHGADIALRMAGGEFCGNATMCAAALLGGAEERELRVRASGAKEPLRVRISPQPDGSVRCAECLPACPPVEYVRLPLGAAERTLPLLRFDGIAHLILPGDLDRGLVERAVPEWCAALCAPALGCMLLDERSGVLTPLVWVPGAGTLYWERSCASGSAAVGAYLAWRRGGPVETKLIQPGGTLYVEAAPVGEIMLQGTVRVMKVGKILV